MVGGTDDLSAEGFEAGRLMERILVRLRAPALPLLRAIASEEEDMSHLRIVGKEPPKARKRGARYTVGLLTAVKRFARKTRCHSKKLPNH